MPDETISDPPTSDSPSDQDTESRVNPAAGGSDCSGVEPSVVQKVASDLPLIASVQGSQVRSWQPAVLAEVQGGVENLPAEREEPPLKDRDEHDEIELLKVVRVRPVDIRPGTEGKGSRFQSLGQVKLGHRGVRPGFDELLV